MKHMIIAVKECHPVLPCASRMCNICSFWDNSGVTEEYDAVLDFGYPESYGCFKFKLMQTSCSFWCITQLMQVSGICSCDSLGELFKKKSLQHDLHDDVNNSWAKSCRTSGMVISGGLPAAWTVNSWTYLQWEVNTCVNLSQQKQERPVRLENRSTGSFQ